MSITVQDLAAPERDGEVVDRTVEYRTALAPHRRSTRGTCATVVAVVLLLLSLSAVVTTVWSLARPAAGEQIRQILRDTLSTLHRSGWGMVLGAVLVVVGLLCIVAALNPGRRHRRVRVTERVGLVVDDTVLADAAADTVARACGLDRQQVTAQVGRRIASVGVVPTSGVPVDRDTARQAVSALLDHLGYDLDVEVRIAQNGVIA